MMIYQKQNPSFYVALARIPVSQVKQSYEITPDVEKGANKETENHERIDFICSSFFF